MKVRRLGAMTLAAAMVITSVPTNVLAVSNDGAPVAKEAVTVPQPEYFWDFEEGNTEYSSKGTIADAKAVLKGTAKVSAEQLTVDGVSHSTAENHVVNMLGGSVGSSYVELPSDLYQGVSAETGMTWSFWIKPAEDVGSYTRALTSSMTRTGNKDNEMGYAPFARDAAWNFIFDDTNIVRQIYNSEPVRGVWSYITISVSSEKITFYINGQRVSSTIKTGSNALLAGHLDEMEQRIYNALGRTYSRWNDPDCKADMDDVALYRTALTAEQVRALAEGYGFDVPEPKGNKDAREGVYQDDTVLTQVDGLTADSPDGQIRVKLWKDTKDSYYYSVSRGGKVVIECSALGLTTEAEDLTGGLALDASGIKASEGVEDYDILSGSSSHVNKPYHELSFPLTKGNSRMTVIFRVFNDGMAFRYAVDGDTGVTGETTVVTGEASEFSLPDKASFWANTPSATYEGYEYGERTVADQYDTSARYSTPVLVTEKEDSGNHWLLLSEANVYNEEEPLPASIFQTEAGNKSLHMCFGQRLEQEEDESYDQQTYGGKYSWITSATMTDEFHTPWRAAVISQDLEGIANTSLITDLNPDPAGDFSWVKPGGSVWSWWSTSADAIDYQAMHDYIDFAAECGFTYCLVDYGWELWDDYEAKISELVAYADEKNIGLLLWYGVNKMDARHIFDLDSEDTIEDAFAWCERMGVKGVKVDYINSDSQFAMKVMYLLADIAARHKLVLNYHGCTNPNGEQRTYPNILSSEAVAGAECFKWSGGSSIATLMTLPFTRNAIGSMEFTPTAYPVTSNPATAGFMLSMAVVYESAVQTYAASAYVYPGYAGTSLLADVPTTWDESLLIDGYPGKHVIRARRSGENWYLGAMTGAAKTYEVPLDFLDEGTYSAYIYKDNADGSNIEVETKKVTAADTLALPLLANGGCAVKLTKTDELKTTIYDNYTYYEAEDGVLAGQANVSSKGYASGLKCVGYVGGNATNTLTFPNVYQEKEGTYEFKLYFVTGLTRDVYVTVNDGEPIKLEGLLGIAGDWNAVSVRSIQIPMKEGDNKIVLSNSEGYAPDIDRIAVEKAEEDDPKPPTPPTPPVEDDSAAVKLLAAVVGAYIEIDTSVYTEESRAAFEAALENAQAVLDESSEMSAADATAALMAAATGLKVDMSLLEDSIENAKKAATAAGEAAAAAQAVADAAAKAEDLATLETAVQAAQSIADEASRIAREAADAETDSAAAIKVLETTLNTINTTAGTAASAAEAAKKIAEAAKDDAAAADSKAQAAQAAAEEAEAAAGAAQTLADTLKTQLEEAKQQGAADQESLKRLEAEVAAAKAAAAAAELEAAAAKESLKAAQAGIEKLSFRAAEPELKKVRSAKKKQLKVTWAAVQGAEGYEILYGMKPSFKKAKKAVVKSAAAKAKTLKKLKRHKRYYVKLRAYKTIAGEKVYSKYSKVKKVKIK